MPGGLRVYISFGITSDAMRWQETVGPSHVIAKNFLSEAWTILAIPKPNSSQNVIPRIQCYVFGVIVDKAG